MTDIGKIRKRWAKTTRLELVMPDVGSGVTASPEVQSIYTGEAIPTPERSALDVAYLLSEIDFLERRLAQEAATRAEIKRRVGLAVDGYYEESEFE